jgi:hypothetical protein
VVEAMSKEPNHQPDLWGFAGTISTAADFQGFLLRLRQETEDYKSPSAKSLLYTAIRALMEKSKTDVSLAGDFLETYVLPRCLDADGLLPASLLFRQEACEILRNWVEQYSDSERIPLRATLMRRVAEELDRSPSPAGVWTLAAFGLRSRWTERVLLKLAMRADPTGDEAVSALCSLMPSGSLRLRLIGVVSQRAAHGDFEKWLYAIQELASPRFIPFLRARLLAGDPDSLLAAGVIGRISDRVPGNKRVQLQVWRVFQEGLTSRTPMIAITNTLSNCNLPEAVKYPLANVGKGGLHPHFTLNHLKECYRSDQLSGWNVDVDELKSRLAESALLPGSRTRSLTGEDLTRSAAWEIAFCAGVADINDWLSRSDVDSPVAMTAALDYASFRQQTSHPPLVARLVTEEVEIGASSDPWYSARLAALRMVAAIERPEALDLIVNCGLSVRGTPLVSTTRLVADLVERLSSRGSGELADRLFMICETRTSANARMSGIAGLQRLAELDLLGTNHRARLFSLVQDESLPDYAAAVLVWTIGVLGTNEAEEAVGAWLVSRLASPRAADKLRFQCFQALIHLGTWARYDEVLSGVLGLNTAEGRIDDHRLSAYGSWQAYALGLLVTRAPDRYWAAARQIIDGAGSDAVHLLLQALCKNPNGVHRLAAELGRTAIQRCIRVLGTSFGETDNFGLIARLAPQEFLFAGWERVWGDWMPQVRCALAESLRAIPITQGADRERIAELLRGLLDDSTYMVRRAAARVYSRVDSVGFDGLCRGWIRSGQTELRTRGAEGAQWLPTDNYKSIDNSIVRDLLQDPEPSVRKAARRSASELRNREWRSFALKGLTSGEHLETGDIRSVYRFGRALAKLSDDETIDALTDLAHVRNTPINVKNWIAKLAEDAEQHWKDTTHAWPEVLSAWSGQIEEIETELEVGSRRLTTKLSLWQKRQEDPTGFISWGGAFEVPLPERMRMMLASPTEAVPLHIQGRRVAQIWYSGATPSGQILFLGTGSYPMLD